MTEVFLIEDHSLVRDGFVRLLGTTSTLVVAGTASSLEEAVPSLTAHPPDVVTLDLELPGVSGKDAVVQLMEVCPQVKIVVVSARLDPPEVRELIELGVLAYVTKGSQTSELLAALEHVRKGEVYLSREAASALATAVRSNRNQQSKLLPERLLEVLRMIAEGKTTREIAQDLLLSPRTVEKYRGEILKRLDCRNQIEAILKARDLDLLRD